MGKTTMVYVTHDQVEAMTLADRICVLKDGLVEQVGTPLELYETPKNIFVAGFIGSPKMNFFDGKFALPYKAQTIGVRSEHMQFVSKGGWAGKVIHAEKMGSDTYSFVDLGLSEPIIIRETGTSRHQVDTKVIIAPMKNRVHRFNAAGIRL